MNVLPTPEGSPAVTPNDSSQIGRKRQRSQSMESDASSSSLKRAPANPGSQDSTRADQMSTLSLTDANLDIDAYMAEQGEEDLEKTTILERPQRHDVKNLPPDEKWALVEGEVKRPMRVGETWYLVERGWWKRWKKACTGKIDKDEPVSEQDLGPVDNSQLLDSHGNLKSPLSEGVDLEYVPEETFQHFVDWYGEPIHPLPRRIVERGATKKTDIELRPPTLNVLRLSSAKSNTRAKRITISAGETVKTLNAKLAAAASPPGDQTQSYRVWKINPPEDDVTSIEFSSSELSAADGKLSGDSEKTLEEEGVQSEDWFVVEYQHDGAWTAEETAGVAAPPATNFGKPPAPLFSFNSEDSFFNKFAKSNKDKDKVTKKNHFTVKEKSIEPGTLGLGNMGNTCFMNSAIQCLAHNKELSDYFFTGLFKEELNPGNPLGMGGAIAESFGALLHRIWAKTGPSYYSPRDFKLQLQRFAPQFSGYQQHDSQELVAFLLDGLHEDLNRVLKKPYVEKPDWEGGDDVDLVKLAKKSWEGYMLRNDSVIVDLFQGQYQSTLVCPECNKVSITFDPFMYLTLPLPIQKKWKHTIYYVPWDLSKTHVQVPIEINGNSSFKDLRNLLGRWMDAPSENLLTLEIFSHKFYKNLDDTVMVGDMAHNDLIVCFELPCHAQQSRNYKRQPGDPIIVPVSLIDATAPSSSARYQSHLPKSGFGYPFVVPVYEEDAKSKEALYDLLLIQLQRWTMNARDLFTWEEGRITELSELTVNGFPPAKDALTEIKENGEVVTVQAAEPPEEEGDIVDEKAMMLDDADPALSAEVLQPRRVGPKKDLFNIRLQTGQKEYGTQQYSRFDSKSYESWADRLKEVGPDAPIVKEGDAFQLEFDESLKAYYFGDEQSKWEHALWETWETFEHSEYLAGKKVASDKANKDLTLQDCLDEFTKEEQLGEDDLWYCPQCKKHQPATKKFQLWTTPDILVVHLKRFSNNRLLRDKIDAFIDFPIEGLDLSDAVGERAIATKLVEQGISLEELELNSHEEPLIYDLFAVDEHIGGLGGGHYRAYALNHANGKWYHFDDSHVSPAKPDEAVNPNAYLLFYRRRTSEPLGGKSHQRIEEARAKAEAEAASVADAETTQEDDSREMKVDLHLPTPPNEEASGPLKDDVWAMLKNNDSSKSYLSSSGMNPALDYSPFGDRSFADNFNNADDEEDHSMKGPGDYSLIAPAYRMPDFPHLTPWRNDFSDAERQKDHIKRYLRDDVDNEDERGSTQASEYPDPSVNVSPSSSNAAEIDSDDLEDLEDPDWAANSTDMPDDQVFPKPLTSRSKLATMEEAEAEAKSADVAKEVIPTDVSEKDSTL